MSQYAMLFEWPTTGGHLDLGRAFSDDGVHWQVLDEAVPRVFYGAYSSDMHFINGKYRIWYSKQNSMEPYDHQIRYVESFDMLTFGNSQLVMSQLDDFGWGYRILAPTVLFKDGLFHMWYMGGSDIGYATSPDGITWTKHPEPVVKNRGAQGVIFDKGIYKMYASAAPYRDIRYLESVDGINWADFGKVLTWTPDTWDKDGVTSPEVIVLGDTYYMWYGGGVAFYPGNWKIGLATSPDGKNWTKHPENPLISPVSPRVSAGVPDVAYMPPMPSKVTGMMAQAITNNSFKLSWAGNPAEEAINLYRVYLSKM